LVICLRNLEHSRKTIFGTGLRIYYWWKRNT